MGFAYGLQYNENTPGMCYQAWEVFSALVVDSIYTLQYLYNPVNWGQGLLVLKDMIDLQASIYGYCDSEKLYNRLAEILSDEGLAQLTSRSLMGIMFEFTDPWMYVREPTLNSFCRAYHTAKIFSVLLNFRI